MAITATGTLTINAAAIKIVGPIEQTGGTITSNGKHIDNTHVHGGVQGGLGSTAPPTV
jgi:phage baseplate assembly protein gpV